MAYAESSRLQPPIACNSYFNKLENNRLPAPGMVVYVPLSLLPFKPEQARLIQTAGKVQNQRAGSKGWRAAG
jgi:hypothetical protein